MYSLKSKQLLIRTAKLSQKNEEKISKKEIKKKINQIKYLASKKKLSKGTLKAEIRRLEKQLQGVFTLEGKLEEEKRQINALKRQTKELKQQLTHAKDIALRRKINKISFLIGELIAKSEIRKEAKVQKALQKIIKKKKTLAPLPKKTALTLKKIDELKAKLFVIKKSGQCPPEKIAQLEKRITDLEKKLPVSTALTSKEIKHKMLFGPKTEEPEPKPEEFIPEIQGLEQDSGELPLPPPPKIRKK